LSKGSCDSVYWSDQYPGWKSVSDDVTGTIWRESTSEEKAAAAEEKAKIDAMKGVGHWFLLEKGNKSKVYCIQVNGD